MINKSQPRDRIFFDKMVTIFTFRGIIGQNTIFFYRVLVEYRKNWGCTLFGKKIPWDSRNITLNHKCLVSDRNLHELRWIQRKTLKGRLFLSFM